MATKKRTPVDPEALRAQLMADPTTAGIAKNLGVELSEYVNQVLHFVQHPKEEPSLYLVEDEDLRQMGLEPPDEDAIGRHLIEQAAVAAAADSTGFDQGKKKLVSMDDLPQVQSTEKTDEKLRDELQKQLRGKRGGKS